MHAVFDLLNGAKMTPQYAQASLEHGVEAVHITLNNYRGINPIPDMRHSLNQLADYRKHLNTLSDLVYPIEEFEDFAKAKAAGKLGIVMGYQNVPGVERDLGLLELFHGLGVRVIQTAHNIRNLYGDGCAEEANAGLSGLGRELIHVLNDLGIVIDLSHVGDQTALDILEISKDPVSVTHANCYTLCANARNKSDQVLDSLKKNGGVLGITYLPPLVILPSKGKPKSSDVVAHIDYAVKRIGIEHVGLGSDFITDQPPERYQEFMRKPEVYGTWPWLYPINDLKQQQDMLSSLTGMGLVNEEIDLIAHGNFMRLFKQVMS